MRKHALTAILIGVLSFGVQSVFAEDIPANTMPLSKFWKTCNQKATSYSVKLNSKMGSM